MMARLLCVALAVAGLVLPGRAQDVKPLPEPEAFYARTRANLDRSRREQGVFAYRERRTELHLNPFGRMGTGGIVLYDVTPLPGGGNERRLLERNGVPVSESVPERREAREPRVGRRARPSAVEDTVAALQFVIDRRVHEAGRDLLAVRFGPRPGATPATREGRLARQFSGTIFVDEAAHEVARVEANAIEDLTYGLGVVARLGKGTSVRLTREQVEPNLWLPTGIRFSGSGRALLFRRMDIDQVIEWFAYRRADAGRRG